MRMIFICSIALKWKIISSTICSIRDKECSGNKQCKHDAADDSLLDYRKR